MKSAKVGLFLFSFGVLPIGPMCAQNENTAKYALIFTGLLKVKPDKVSPVFI